MMRLRKNSGHQNSRDSPQVKTALIEIADRKFFQATIVLQGPRLTNVSQAAPVQQDGKYLQERFI